jgi:hypothetical protein
MFVPKIKIGTLINNNDQKVNYIMNLKPGDKLKAKKLITSRNDIGLSGLIYKYNAFIPGKMYKVNHLFNWGGNKVAYVADEDGTLHFAVPEIFELVDL